jgi:predicted transcriptional regulator
MRKRFNPREEKMIDLLQEMDISRSLARIIVFFSINDKCVCNDIQRVTELRQPEISMAMQYLREREWIITEPLHREKKGRPIINYRLAMPFDKIINTLIREEHARIRDMKVKLISLKKMTK